MAVGQIPVRCTEGERHIGGCGNPNRVMTVIAIPVARINRRIILTSLVWLPLIYRAPRSKWPGPMVSQYAEFVIVPFPFTTASGLLGISKTLAIQARSGRSIVPCRGASPACPPRYEVWRVNRSKTFSRL